MNSFTSIGFRKIGRMAGIASLLAVSCVTAWAARDFTPQAGTWAFTEELNGQPGRGLAIDVQGNTFFIQVFGYEKNGDATFYAASGKMSGNSVTAPLMRYRGGRSFGSAAQDAVEDQALGNVTVHFKNGIKGTIQFPNEPAMDIQRFLVQSEAVSVTNPRKQLGERSLQIMALDPQGNVADHWNAGLRWAGNNSFRLTLKKPSNYFWGSLESVEELSCQLQNTRTQWICEQVPYFPEDMRPRLVEELRLELAGNDLSGMVRMKGKSPMPLTGFNLAALYSPPRKKVNGPHTVDTVHQQDYRAFDTGKESFCFLACWSYEFVNTLMPENGVWVVEDEITGRPGRGLALDIQGDTAILQVYNYRADGRPTFHMGNAAYLSQGIDSFATAASIPMNVYAGGRSLGGPQQSAQLHRYEGNAQLRFAYQKIEGQAEKDWMWSTEGQLQLPHEEPVRIRRIQLEKAANAAQEMMGQWFIPRLEKTFTLSRVVASGAASEDGSVVCSLPTGKAGITCTGQSWIWSALPEVKADTMIRLRDRHGNAVGLGSLD